MTTLFYVILQFFRPMHYGIRYTRVKIRLYGFIRVTNRGPRLYSSIKTKYQNKNENRYIEFISVYCT